MFALLTILSTTLLSYALPSPTSCHPFRTIFTTSQSDSFIAISPRNSYNMAGDGLHLYLDNPGGDVTRKGGVNNKVADGATFNSTFTFLYGKVTFDLYAPIYAGVVTAAILIADQGDEIDIELLGSHPSHFQTNIFAPQPTDHGPLYGVFSSTDDLPSGDSGSGIQVMHSYSIDWNAERIIWSVDGKEIRTLRKDQTMDDSALHFPSHPVRIQLGIWDASNPAGTAEWAGGPIDWEQVPKRMEAVFKSVQMECP
ncbi:glycoside hydrolase family 16 protein [Jaapia argillacea MUCL 33604]|uniref:Glycoside hydrolase family 16 protein n=1 Tax=Jaapia argillacea MUCL 33604 TaxID=933084 RepID=A0A067P668_9AGAM|nr:glycoside hydrolase family 16 protein [Jaapia argillacea MUCL 33604]